jgi:predicted nucleic acid-binding protein
MVPDAFALPLDEQIQINSAVVNFLAANQLPITLVDDIHFRKLLTLLNDRYQPPCSEILAYLATEDVNHISEVKDDIQSKFNMAGQYVDM